MQRIISLPLSLLIALFLVVCSITPAQAQRKPDWVENYGDTWQYPQDKYIIGFGSTAGRDSEAFQIAQDDARAGVSSTIVVNVEKQLRMVREEDQQKFSQHVISITQSSAALRLKGLSLETYGDDNPATAYALAYVSKEALKEIYSKTKSDLRGQIRRIIADAQEAEGDSKSMEAATKYLSLYPLYAELKEAESILLVVDPSTRIETAFDELDREIGEASSKPKEAPLMSWTEVANKIDQLLSQSLGTVDEVARSVVIQLSKQVGDLSGQLMIVPFTYQDTKMSSSFARYFRSAVENQIGLMTTLKWDAVSQKRGFKPKSFKQITSELAKASGAQWLFSGTYWEQGEKIKLMANLYDLDGGRILAAADVLFDASILEAAHLNPKPENFLQALKEQNAFADGEIISGQLQVDVWTSKGKDNLLFTEGEIMNVYVRVNRPAYIRLLYILAGGERTLLYDNYYIDQSKVNHAVEIPEEFECAPPFGAEMLVVFARTKGFEPLKTVEVDGYHYLEADSPIKAAAQARGMKRREDKEILQTEARIVITTIEE